MKQILSFLVLLISGVAMAQEGPVSFSKTEHQFGKIPQGTPASFVFEFTNKSNKPQVVEFANADCGCTSPIYTEGAIPPGKKGTVKVTYNAAEAGGFSKNVTIKFLGNNTPYILVVKGEVTPKKVTKPVKKS